MSLKTKLKSCSLTTTTIVCLILLIISICTYVVITKYYIKAEISRALSHIETTVVLSDSQRQPIQEIYTTSLSDMTGMFFKAGILLLVSTVALYCIFIAYILCQKRASVQQIELFRNVSQRDSLTNFYNKKTTHALVQRHLDSCTRTTALMLLDIDNFKVINDTLGHICGDAVLAEISSSISSIFREHDIVGRIGGDEFAILLTNVTDMPMIMSRAKQVLDACERTISRNGATHQVSCSVGIALSPDDGVTFDELYQKADIALYTSKKQGKNRISFAGEN